MQQTTENVEITAKPLKGKYDGRGKYDRSHLHKRLESKPGPKPQYLHHLSRNTSSKVLQAFDLIASIAQLYQAAWDAKKLELCVQMRENAENRLFGKPFTALNPNEGKKPTALVEDHRLQVAIGTLVVTGKRAKGKKAKQIEAVSAVTEAPGTIDTPAPDVSDSTQVVDSEAPEPSL